MIIVAGPRQVPARLRALSAVNSLPISRLTTPGSHGHVRQTIDAREATEIVAARLLQIDDGDDGWFRLRRNVGGRHLTRCAVWRAEGGANVVGRGRLRGDVGGADHPH